MGEFTSQNRGGKGVKCYKITDKTGNVVGVKAVNEDNEIMLITIEGIIIRTECSGIAVLGRITSGVKVMDTSACALCKQNKIPINVFDFKAQGSLVKIMNGEEVGTFVSVN